MLASRQRICDAVAERSDTVRQSLRDQWQHLVLRPLSKLHKPAPYVVVLDALDECDNDSNSRVIVRLLVQARPLISVFPDEPVGSVVPARVRADCRR
jgi:hypothetical protein